MKVLYDWHALYARHFPHDTDASSRHVQQIAEGLRLQTSPIASALLENGHANEDLQEMAASMEATVKELWKLRAEKRERDKRCKAL